MRMNKFKKHIAGFVATSMGVSLLVPQIPVWAVEDLHKGIKFDLGIYTQFEGVTLDDIPYTGTPKIKDDSRFADRNKFPLDTGFNLQDSKAVSSESLEMPWWNYKWIANDTGASSTEKKQNSYEYEVKQYVDGQRTGTAPTYPNVSWNDKRFNFPGYRLVSWTESTGVSDRKVNKLPEYFPYRETTYKANYKSDGTLFKVTTKYESETGYAAPINAGDEKVVTKNTDDSYQTPIIRIPGYDVELNDADIKIYNPITNEVEEGKTYTTYGWTKDADKHLQGKVFNKNLELTYKYKPSKVGFVVDISHKILNKDGTLNRELSERVPSEVEESSNDPSAIKIPKTIKAEETISGVGPMSSLVEQKSADKPARYILVKADDVDTNSLKKAPKVTRGTTANTEGHVAALQKTGESYFDQDGKLLGKMPNQNIAVEYVYIPNPDYKLNVEVTYVDGNGRPLTSTVLQNKGAGFDNLTETADHAVVVQLEPNVEGSVPYPDLSSLGYMNPSYAVTENGLEAGTITEETGKLKFGMKETSYKIKVTYQKDPSKWGSILVENEGNLTLMGDDTEEYSSQAFPIEAEKDSDNKLLVTDEVAATFPTIKPNLGYKVLGYYFGDTKVADENKHIVGTSPYKLEASGNDYKLVAKVEKDTLWKDYTLEYDGGENGSMTPATKAIQLYPNDISGNPREIKWSKLAGANPDDEFVGLVPETTADTGYEIRWYDPNNTQITDNTDIVGSYPSGTKFIARAVSTSPLAVNAPSISSNINENTGEVEIKVAKLNPDPTVNYVVTDESGKIIKRLTASELQDKHKILSDVAIRPDATYKVYEVLPSADIGDNISETPEADRSPASEIKTPVAPIPDIVPDTAGKTKAIFEPITKGMSYAIVGPDGNVVIPWTTPAQDGRTFVAPSLDPDTRYTVVVKPATASDAETDKMPGMNFETIAQSANNRIILVNPDDIEINEPAGLDITSVKSGTVVTLKAKPINAAGDVFRGANGWELIMGAPTNVTGDGNTLYRFTMPRGNVVLRARYGAYRASWSPAIISDAQNKASDLGISNPDIDVAGKFRVYLERKDATPSNASAITTARAKFNGLFQLRSKVQKENAGVWEDYNNFKGNILTSVNTGILQRDNREYALYELVEGGEPVLAYTLTEADYENGQFMTELKNGVEYIFGYNEADAYKLEIKDNRNDLTLANIKIRYDAGLKSLSDYSDKYTVPAVGTQNVGTDGVTYVYRGLSDNESSFNEVDVNRALAQEDVIFYAYYDNDRIERQEAQDELTKLVDYAKTIDKAAIKPALEEAQSVLKQLSPRKATTTELRAAINKLRAALDSLFPSNGGGHGGSGGTGNRNAGAQTGVNNGLSWYKTYTVGTDGRWKLLDKDNHVWAFEFNNGTRVTGWANLAYTYNGIRRVETYHFRNDGIMDYGWFKDESARWFYMSEVHDGFFGHLIRGWYKDNKDGKWYYLSPIDGHMHTGWNSIKNIWYFLSPENNVEPTWRYNESTNKWDYVGNSSVRPLGSMYENERTPDNYYVDGNGAWIEGR